MFSCNPSMFIRIFFFSLLLLLVNASEGKFRDEDYDSREDEDARFLRGSSKASFDEMQLHRYCKNHVDHYWHYCAGSATFTLPVRAKLFKFCPTFEKYCPHMTGKEPGNGKLALPPPLPKGFQRSKAPLVIPPSISTNRLNPTMDSPVAYDLPIASMSKPLHSIQAPRRRVTLTPEMIKLCTPDCTLPHCTDECKCANTHPTVHMMCNPPPHSDLVSTCDAWYRKCPMFHPVHY